MSCVGVRYDKTNKVYIEPEATCGTYEPITSSSFAVPVVSRPTPTIRGSAMIDRTNTLDGHAGDIVGVPGSYAYEVTLESELQIPATTGPNYATIGYWGAMLLASGFGLTVDSDVTGDYFEYTLDERPLANYVGGDGQAPAPSSITLVQQNSEISDWQIKLKGCTGVTSFDFTPGEIATISTAFKGLLEGTTILDTSDVDISASGPSFNLNIPLVVKGIALTVYDVTNSETIAVRALRSLSISMNTENPDMGDPAETYGYAISPVIPNPSPTISFQFPDTVDLSDIAFQSMLDGRLVSIDIELQAASGGARFIKFTMPITQFTGVSLTNTNGMVDWAVDAKLVRQPGEPSSSLISIKYYHTLA